MRSHRAISSRLVAAIAAELPASVPGAFRLLPLGSFRAIDGRPRDLDAWILTVEDAERIAADIAALARDLPIDYEHQILEARRNGQPAPAAGWIKRVGVRTDGDAPGLWAEEVVWTERARAMIAAGEYRYVSPVFAYDSQTGRVTRLIAAALTNSPGLDGLTDLQPLTMHQEDDMPTDHMTALREALGISDTRASHVTRGCMEGRAGRLIADGLRSCACGACPPRTLQVRR